jgi:hypothetical protein
MNNMKTSQFRIRNFKKSESSFTLLETIIALGLMVTIVLEVATIQGNSISFSENNRNFTQATWLAQAVLAKVEWYSKFYDFKEIKYEGKDQKFSDELCPQDPKYGECQYKYNLTIEPFPLPIEQLIIQQLTGGGSEEGGNSTFSSMIEQFAKKYLGDEILKLAHVEVYWPEGSKTSGVEISYLLANQKKIDEEIFKLQPLNKENQKQSTQNKKSNK